MKEFSFLFVILFLSSLFSGCAKDEDPISEFEDSSLKGAKVELITIPKILPNGKVIYIKVPPNSVEHLIAASPKLPYSPEGVYLFYHKESQTYWDVFITYWDGVWLKGTVCYPAGGNYEIIGEIDNPIKKSVPYPGFHIFYGWFIIDGNQEYYFLFGTSEYDGIIKNWEIYPLSTNNEFLVLSTKPYSPEGFYYIYEYDDIDPVDDYSLWITSFDKNNFKGNYISQFNEGELEGNIGESVNELAPLTMNLYTDKIADGILFKTIEGYVDINGGIVELNEPFGFPPSE